jgi:hypothetical protein
MESLPFFDVALGRTVIIPASESRPGCVQIQLQGSNDVVWADSAQLERGEMRQPPFNDAMGADIKKVRVAFAEIAILLSKNGKRAFAATITRIGRSQCG